MARPSRRRLPAREQPRAGERRGEAASATAEAPAQRERLDKWLWRARFFKTRTVAAAAVSGGKVRVNAERQLKPGYAVKCGDALTIARAGEVFVVRIEGLGERRGPAAEAQTLYSVID